MEDFSRDSRNICMTKFAMLTNVYLTEAVSSLMNPNEKILGHSTRPMRPSQNMIPNTNVVNVLKYDIKYNYKFCHIHKIWSQIQIIFVQWHKKKISQNEKIMLWSGLVCLWYSFSKWPWILKSSLWFLHSTIQCSPYGILYLVCCVVYSQFNVKPIPHTAFCIWSWCN